MRLLSDLFDAADTLAEQKGIDRIRTFGEHYIAAVGLSVPRLDHAHRAVEFADALAAEWGRLAHERGLPLRLRVALASGDIRLGLIGANRFTWDVWGRTLNTVRRLVHEAGENELRIAASTYELLGNKDTFVQKANISTASIGSLTSYARLFPSARMTLQTAAE
jgi:class 3 adenylate cyclase